MRKDRLPSGSWCEGQNSLSRWAVSEIGDVIKQVAAGDQWRDRRPDGSLWAQRKGLDK